MKTTCYLIVVVTALLTQAGCTQRLTVMTYNIHHGADRHEVDQIPAMAAFIKASGADIIGLQEVDSVCTRSGKVDQMKVLAALTGLHYGFVRHFEYQGGAYGMGILSRYPIHNIENRRMTLLKSKNPSTAMIAATIVLPRHRKVKFASAHFALDDSSRLVQAGLVIDYLKQQELPVVFTGDLNATPDSPEIRLLKAYFKETDTRSVATYPVPAAQKKIDYIMIRKSDRPRRLRHEVPAQPWSDHLPVLGRFRLP